jgi:hypothetical protein
MTVSQLRPLLFFGAGAAVTSLIFLGLTSRQQPAQQTNLAATGTPSQEGKKAAPSPSTTSDIVAADTPIAEASPSPTVEAKLAKPSASQSTNLPLGLRPDAVNMDVYKKLPGVQPPLINWDGRNIGPEAIQMLETHRPEVPFPGTNPNATVAPMPFPQSKEEIDQQASQIYPSPSASPSAQ